MSDAGTGQAHGPVVPLAKAEGAFLALAAGDALGWPQEMRRNVRNSASGVSPRIEFQTWTRRTGGWYRPYEETIGAGEYSDDTQLTLALARSRTNHGVDWWKAFMQSGTAALDDLRTRRRRRDEAGSTGLARRQPAVAVAA